MSAPGERPAVVSGRYPLSPDPADLQRCVLEHARELDRSLDHHRAHSYRLGELESARAEHDSRLDTVAVELARLRTAVAVGAAALTIALSVVQIVIALVTK
jgi:hypothetical protein